MLSIIKYLTLFMCLNVVVFVKASQINSPPSEFEYVQSTFQAFYFFFDAYDEEGNHLEPSDWVGAFNGDVCVGAIQWDVNQCGEGICAVPVMGDDGSSWASAYMSSGEVPTFKIYDSSTGTYSDAVVGGSVTVNNQACSDGYPGCYGWENFGFYMTESLSVSTEESGCLDSEAANYNPNATIDDGSCFYTPDGLFNFDQSTTQAFYFFVDAVGPDGESLESNDWIAVYNGDICVGAKQWDLSQCGGGICDLVAMGDDGSPWTAGYMTPNDIPIFKIFDSSSGELYSAIPSNLDGCDLYPDCYGWQNFGFYTSNLLEVAEFYNYSISLHEENNLISFYSLPANTLVSSIANSILPNIIGIQGASESAIYSDGGWSGSLENLNSSSGYWVRMLSPDTLNISGLNYDPNMSYDLNQGLNLISFPAMGSVDLPSAIPDNIEDNILYVIGESKAALQVDDGWVGSLSKFENTKGYWIASSEELNFNYELDVLSKKSNASDIQDVYLDNFTFNQSTLQSFYFIDKLDVGDLNDNFIWIMAYHNDILVGYRKWSGNMTDIPVMGSDGSELTELYLNLDDRPSFKLYNELDGSITPLRFKNIDTWEPNRVFVIEASDKALLPNHHDIVSIYPNPFNPQTNIQFQLSADNYISLNIVDIKGRVIDQLVKNELYQTGYHSVTWAPKGVSSGVYLLQLVHESGQLTQKIILTK